MATTASEADHTNFYMGLTAHNEKSAASEEHLGASKRRKEFRAVGLSKGHTNALKIHQKHEINTHIKHHPRTFHFTSISF